MSPGSLRLRLLVGASLATAAALALAWIAMTLIFDRHLEQRVADELQRQALPLIAGLRIEPAGPVLDDEPADPRFATPASGLYWQVASGGGMARSRSLWDAALPVPAAGAGWQRREAHGPFGQRLLLIARGIRPHARGPGATVQLGYDLAQLAPARREFGAEMALFLALLWAGLSAAAWLQVTLGLRPLRQVEGEVGRLRQDAAARLAGRYPREVAPLALAIDALADAREADLARARRRAADLAHGLKTPLAALAAQSRRARAAGAGDAADGLDRAIAAVAAAVDAELARTRIGLGRRDGGVCDAGALIEGLVGVLEHTGAGERIGFAVEVAEGLRLPLGTDDAGELIGPLIENAARHARRRVLVRGTAAGGSVRIDVEDDGPGIHASRRGEAVLRGERLDAAGPGHGLGLAIARELTGATGGELVLAPSTLGGLCVSVRWDTASPG